MPPTKFWLNRTYRSRVDAVWRFSRWPPWWISEQNNFSNSESLYCSDAFHQVSALSNLQFGRRMLFEEFQDGHHSGHLGYRNRTILSVLNVHVNQCLPPSFGLIWITVWEEMSFEDFQDRHYGGHLGYWNRRIWAILNLHVAQMPPTKFKLNLTWFWRRCYDVKNVKS